jgi:hypothetical protein
MYRAYPKYIAKGIEQRKAQNKEKDIAKDPYKKMDYAILDELNELISKQDMLIQNDWRIAFDEATNLLLSAPSRTDLIKNESNFSHVREIDRFFATATREARKQIIQGILAEESLKSALKVAGIIVGIASITAAATYGLAKNDLKNWQINNLK